MGTTYDAIALNKGMAKDIVVVAYAGDIRECNYRPSYYNKEGKTSKTDSDVPIMDSFYEYDVEYNDHGIPSYSRGKPKEYGRYVADFDKNMFFGVGMSRIAALLSPVTIDKIIEAVKVEVKTLKIFEQALDEIFKDLVSTDGEINTAYEFAREIGEVDDESKGDLYCPTYNMDDFQQLIRASICLRELKREMIKNPDEDYFIRASI